MDCGQLQSVQLAARGLQDLLEDRKGPITFTLVKRLVHCKLNLYYIVTAHYLFFVDE